MRRALQRGVGAKRIRPLQFEARGGDHGGGVLPVGAVNAVGSFDFAKFMPSRTEGKLSLTLPWICRMGERMNPSGEVAMAGRNGPLELRRAGLLVPVFAMRHRDDFGVGDTRAVREAIDFCAENGFSVLQMLPIHETFGDHSPYNPISSRALSPAYIYLDPEEVPGLSAEDLERAAPEAWLAHLRTGRVRHGSVHPLKAQILRLAWHRFRTAGDAGLLEEFEEFARSEAGWLEGYTLFRLLIREYEGNGEWLDWRPEHQDFQSANEWFLQHPEQSTLAEVRRGFAFAQWVAQRQWAAVREHADRRGVLLMGEMSFGVGRGSADVWANPELFDLKWSLGTRPLAHFDTSKDAERWGQNWGLPAYRWENHRSSGFEWLRARVAGERRFFHLCRLDHLRGYFRVYMFPWPGGPRHSEFSNLTDEEAALRTGGKLPRFVPGPDEDPLMARMNELQGREIISVIREAAGPMELVAELMGEMPEYMKCALSELPLANLTFPQLEKTGGHAFRELSLVTYANHDNAPLATIFLHLQRAAANDPASAEAAELSWWLDFAGWKGPPPDDLDDELLAALQSALFNTPCRLAILMCSDLFGLPLRFNLPGSYGLETWCERLDHPFSDYSGHGVFGPRLAAVREMILSSGRGSCRNSPTRRFRVKLEKKAK
jgi:4-alpha-glucanotransferase